MGAAELIMSVRAWAGCREFNDPLLPPPGPRMGGGWTNPFPTCPSCYTTYTHTHSHKCTQHIHSQKNVSVVQYLLQQANIKSLKITFINLEHWTGPSWSWLEKSELERLFWLAKNITIMAMTRMIMTRLLWNSIDCIITTMNVPRLWLSYTVERRILYISHKNSHTTTVRLLRISYLTDLERDSS